MEISVQIHLTLENTSFCLFAHVYHHCTALCMAQATDTSAVEICNMWTCPMCVCVH